MGVDAAQAGQRSRNSLRNEPRRMDTYPNSAEANQGLADAAEHGLRRAPDEVGESVLHGLGRSRQELSRCTGVGFLLCLHAFPGTLKKKFVKPFAGRTSRAGAHSTNPATPTCSWKSQTCDDRGDPHGNQEEPRTIRLLRWRGPTTSRSSSSGRAIRWRRNLVREWSVRYLDEDKPSTRKKAAEARACARAMELWVWLR